MVQLGSRRRMIRRKRFRMMLEQQSENAPHLLPAEYRQLEYLEGGVESYINTSLTYYKTTVYADVAFPYGNACAVGVSVNGQKSTKHFQIMRSYNYNSSIQAMNCNKNVWHRTNSLSERVQILYNSSDGKLYVNGVEVDPSNPMDGGAPSGIPVFLFAYNDSGSPSLSSPLVRIYRITIWDKLSGALQRDFIPCYRKADGTPGMYDLVSGTLFVNAGTGTFERGTEI